jgi:serine/threonine protein kinase
MMHDVCSAVQRSGEVQWWSGAMTPRAVVEVCCSHQSDLDSADIKPSNLLLDKGTVKLADFGASATVNLGEDNA